MGGNGEEGMRSIFDLINRIRARKLKIESFVFDPTTGSYVMRFEEQEDTTKFLGALFKRDSQFITRDWHSWLDDQEQLTAFSHSDGLRVIIWPEDNIDSSTISRTRGIAWTLFLILLKMHETGNSG